LELMLAMGTLYVAEAEAAAKEVGWMPEERVPQVQGMVAQGAKEAVEFPEEEAPQTPQGDLAEGDSAKRTKEAVWIPEGKVLQVLGYRAQRDVAEGGKEAV
jgi:hypothetical protein